MTAGFLQMCAEKLLRKRKNESWAMSRAVQCCDRFEMPVAPCHLQFSRTHSVRTCRHTSPTLGVGGNLYEKLSSAVYRERARLGRRFWRLAKTVFAETERHEP